LDNNQTHNQNMQDVMIRNVNRQRNTINRYVVDSNTLWSEELHPRIENLPILNIIIPLIEERIKLNIWNFPVDEQSIENTRNILYFFALDYFNFVAGRRTAKYTQTYGYWTEKKITYEIAQAFINILWDYVNNLLIDNYPLVSDDLRHRTGKNYSGDLRETHHDNTNKLNTASQKATTHQVDNEKSLINQDAITSNSIISRDTTNNVDINDTFLSPQDQGVKPSTQSTNVLGEEIITKDFEKKDNFQNPDNMGVKEIINNAINADFTTTTNVVNSANTSTSSNNTAGTTKSNQQNLIQGESVNANVQDSTIKEVNNNLGAKAQNNTFVERFEDLNMSSVLTEFYNLFKDRLMLEIDNRMLPYYLNMKINRFVDFRMNTKKYL